MTAPQREHEILRKNESLIDMAVLSAATGSLSPALGDALTMYTIAGLHELAAAVRQIVAGEHDTGSFSHLDEEDSLVITAILDILHDNDELVSRLLLAARQFATSAPGQAQNLIDAAAAVNPGNYAVIAMQGTMFAACNHLQAAVDAYRRSLALEPSQQDVLLDLGRILVDLSESGQAIEVFERALELEPDNLAAFTQLASLYEVTFDLEHAEAMIERGLAVDPQQPTLLYVKAKLLQRAGDVDGAIRVFEQVVENGLEKLYYVDIFSRLGYLYDRKGDTSGAIRYFKRANNVYRRLYEKLGVNKQSLAPGMDHFNRIVARTVLDPAGLEDEDHDPVFLVGFPRSGTTLLNQILDSHPGIDTLEEKPLAAPMFERLIEFGNNHREDTVLFLSRDETSGLRRAYFDAVKTFLKPRADKILVDKFPLNIMFAPILHRLFPRGKFILALRHPCDACLSCYMHAFDANPATAHFTTVEDTVSLYARVMEDWRMFVDSEHPAVHELRYESLVADFEDEVTKLLDFLGVGWDESVRSHARHSQRKGWINTPSYNQVTEPIYTRAVYRWQRYAELFEPHMIRLQPFIETFYGHTALD